MTDTTPSTSEQSELAAPMPEVWRHLLTTWVAMQLDYHKASDRMRAAGSGADACVNEARAEMLSWCSKELLAVVKRLPASCAAVATPVDAEAIAEAVAKEFVSQSLAQNSNDLWQRAKGAEAVLNRIRATARTTPSLPSVAPIGETCTRAGWPCRYRDARQCARDTMLGDECPKVCECPCHTRAATPVEGEQIDRGVWFQSAVSGGWYQDARAVGNISEIRIDGATVYKRSSIAPPERATTQSSDLARAAEEIAAWVFKLEKLLTSETDLRVAGDIVSGIITKHLGSAAVPEQDGEMSLADMLRLRKELDPNAPDAVVVGSAAAETLVHYDLFAPCRDEEHSDCIQFSNGLRRDAQLTRCVCDCHAATPPVTEDQK